MTMDFIDERIRQLNFIGYIEFMEISCPDEPGYGESYEVDWRLLILLPTTRRVPVHCAAGRAS